MNPKHPQKHANSQTELQKESPFNGRENRKQGNIQNTGIRGTRHRKTQGIPYTIRKVPKSKKKLLTPMEPYCWYLQL